MAKFVKLESGEIVNVNQIVAIAYSDVNESKIIYTTAVDNRVLGDTVISLRFKVTESDIKNILKASEE